MNPSAGHALPLIQQHEKIQFVEAIGVTKDDAMGVSSVLFDHVSSMTLRYSEHISETILSWYIPPILVIIGTSGNLASFLVMRRKSMARKSTYTFLSALSIFDSMVLVVGLLRQWTATITGFDIRDQAGWLCKSTVMLSSMCGHITAWIVIAVTIDRYLAINYPLKSNLCNTTKAKKVILALIVAFLALNLHWAWTVDLHERVIDGDIVLKCDVRGSYRYFVMSVWPWVDILTYCVIPFFTISTFNILIMFNAWRKSNERKRLGKLITKVGDRNLRLTVTLLTVSFSFLITNLPINISMFLSEFVNERGYGKAAMSTYSLFSTASHLLMYMNHCFNLFLYCITGRKFRNEVMRLFCGKKFGNATIDVHSQHLYCSRNCKH